MQFDPRGILHTPIAFIVAPIHIVKTPTVLKVGTQLALVGKGMLMVERGEVASIANPIVASGCEWLRQRGGVKTRLGALYPPSAVLRTQECGKVIGGSRHPFEQQETLEPPRIGHR